MQLTKDWAATLDDYVIDLAWSLGGNALAAASASGPISVFGRQGKPQFDLAGHENGTNALAFGSRLVSGGQDGSVKIWNAGSSEPAATARCGTAWVEHLALSSDRIVAAAGRDLHAISPEGMIVSRLWQAPKTITAVISKPGSSAFAAACFGAVRVFDLKNDGGQAEFAYGNGIHALAWSPDGKWLVSGNQDPSVHLWIPQDGSELHMSGYETKVKHLAFDHTSRWLATSGGRDACIWDCSGAGPENRDPNMLPHDAPVCALAFQHAHGLLATASQDGVVMLWSPERKQPLRATVKMPTAAAKLAWSGDDLQLAIGTEKGAVYVLRADRD